MNNNYPYSYGNSSLFPQRIPVVNGRDGAELYKLAPDSNVILMDQSGKLIWVVGTDSAGYRSIQGYSITPYVEPAPPDFNLLISRMSRMEEMLSGLISASNNTGEKSGNGAATTTTTTATIDATTPVNRANMATQF